MGNKIDKLSIADEISALEARRVVEDARFTIESIEVKPIKRNPAPPFTTSTLQQEAARKLGFSASHTMRCAQTLYESGVITYMRTDGVQMDTGAIYSVRDKIGENTVQALSLKNLEFTQAKPKMRRRHMRRSGPQTLVWKLQGLAMKRNYTLLFLIGRWQARWRQRNWKGQHSFSGCNRSA